MPKAKPVTPLTAAHRAVVEGNTGLVGKVLATYFPYLDGDDYEEGFREGLVGLCKAAVAFDPGRGWKFSTYGCVVVKRHLVNWVERHQKRGFRGLSRRRVEYPLSVDPGVWDLIADRERGPEAPDVLTLGRLEAAVRRLGVRHQLVIRFLYLGGETTPQVAERLHVCRNRIQQLHQEALKELRAMTRAA